MKRQDDVAQEISKASLLERITPASAWPFLGWLIIGLLLIGLPLMQNGVLGQTSSGALSRPTIDDLRSQPLLKPNDAQVLPTCRLPVADLASLARIDELLESRKFTEAIDLLVVLIEQPDSPPLLSAQSTINAQGEIGQTYRPLAIELQRRLALAARSKPQWLATYRARVDRRAALALLALRQSRNLDQEAEQLESFLLTTDASIACESLADRYLEADRAADAVRWYRRLLETDAAVLLNDGRSSSNPDGESTSPSAVSTPDSLREENGEPINEAGATVGSQVESPQRQTDTKLPPGIVRSDIFWLHEQLTSERRRIVAYKLSVALWLSGQRVSAIQLWRWLNSSEAESTSVTFSVYGRSTDARAWSAEILGLDPKASQTEWANREQEIFLAQALEQDSSDENGVQLDHQSLPSEVWQIEWQQELSPLNWTSDDRRFNREGAGAGGSLWLPSIEPFYDDDRVVVWDGQRLRVFDRFTGEPWISLGALFDDDPERAGMVWEAATYQTPNADPRPVEGAPRYLVSNNGNEWSVRGGDPRVIVQDDSTRVRSWRASFNQFRDGALLPGSPWFLEPGLEWEGGALGIDGRWWSVQRQAAHRDERSQAWLVAWEQPTSIPTDAQQPQTPNIRFRIPLGEGTNMARGAFHECSHVSPWADAASVYVAGPLGSIVAVNRFTGRPRWWFTYPQQLADSLSRSDLSLHRLREGGMVWSNDELVVAIPPDSDQLFGLQASTGRLLWAIRCPEVGRVVGQAGRWILVAGSQLIWIDSQTGHIAQRFPRSDAATAVPLENQRVSASGLQPLWGQVALKNGWVFCSTATHLEIVRASLDLRELRDGTRSWRVERVRSIPWSHWSVSGGHLQVAPMLDRSASTDKLPEGGRGESIGNRSELEARWNPSPRWGLWLSNDQSLLLLTPPPENR